MRAQTQRPVNCVQSTAVGGEWEGGKDFGGRTCKTWPPNGPEARESLAPRAV